MKKKRSLRATNNYHGRRSSRVGTLSAFSHRKKSTGGEAIERQFALLETEPGVGRPFDDLPEFRELIIPFGDTGYVALYHHEVNAGSVYVLAFRHQKEAGY